jgi:hypothetical protein
MKPAKQEIARKTTPEGTHDIVISSCPEGVWILVYQGQPFQIRREHLFNNDLKYLPNSWSQRGSAVRQAQYLNQLFDTDQFQIAQIQG